MPTKDLKNQDDCYRKFYLYAHEGHGEGWSKLHFWQIWCDSRGHSALGSTALMTDSPKSMQVQIHLGPTFVFHSPSWVLIQPTAWNLWQSSIWAGLKLSFTYSSLDTSIRYSWIHILLPAICSLDVQYTAPRSAGISRVPRQAARVPHNMQSQGKMAPGSWWCLTRLCYCCLRCSLLYWTEEIYQKLEITHCLGVSYVW